MRPGLAEVVADIKVEATAAAGVLAVGTEAVVAGTAAAAAGMAAVAVVAVVTGGKPHGES